MVSLAHSRALRGTRVAGRRRAHWLLAATSDLMRSGHSSQTAFCHSGSTWAQ